MYTHPIKHKLLSLPAQRSSHRGACVESAARSMRLWTSIRRSFQARPKSESMWQRTPGSILNTIGLPSMFNAIRRIRS